MTPGLISKFFLMISTSSSEERSDVPYDSTKSDKGSATPIAYDSCTSTRRANFACTKDFAIHRAKYAADLSTLE